MNDQWLSHGAFCCFNLPSLCYCAAHHRLSMICQWLSHDFSLGMSMLGLAFSHAMAMPCYLPLLGVGVLAKGWGLLIAVAGH